MPAPVRIDSSRFVIYVQENLSDWRLYSSPLVPLSADFIKPVMERKRKRNDVFGSNQKTPLGMTAREARDVETYVNYRKLNADSPDEWRSYQIKSDVRRFVPIWNNRKPQIWRADED
jgi:hypothetical protein